MEPGQAAIRAGVLLADTHGSLNEQVALSAEVPWSDRWSVTAQTAVLYNGALKTRDSTLGVRARVIDTASMTLRIEPGLSLPTGSTGVGLAYTPLSTGSVDPRLSVDLVTGSTWVLATSANVRVPLYDGLDGQRQGPYGYIDVRGARRLGKPVIPYVGVSAAAATQVDAFTEFAGLAGAIWAPNERWALGVNARVPWNASYLWAAGLSVSRVVGEATDNHQH